MLLCGRTPAGINVWASPFLLEEVAGGLHLSKSEGIKSVIVTEAPLKKIQWLAEQPGMATVTDSCRWHRRAVI